MKTREQKIKQAIELYVLLRKFRKNPTNRLRESALLDYIMENCNHRDFYFYQQDISSMSVDELYEGFMRENIIYL